MSCCGFWVGGWVGGWQERAYQFSSLVQAGDFLKESFVGHTMIERGGREGGEGRGGWVGG